MLAGRISRVVLVAVFVLALEIAAYELLTSNTGWVSWNGWTWLGWNAVTGVATFLAVVVALALGIWGDELKGFGRRPRLGLTLDPVPDHFQKFLTEANTSLYCVRISVTNDGDRPAKGVELWAQELLVKGPDGNFKRDPAFMAMNLIRTHVGGTVTPVIHPGIPKPYDLGQVIDPDVSKAARREVLLFELSTEVSTALIQPAGLREGMYSSWKPAGTYRLVLAIAADSIDVVRRVVEITWTGEWSLDPDTFFRDKLKVSLV